MTSREEPQRPNILFCISDDQSFPHASAYGTRWVSTPAFDRIAAEGLLFMNAYTPNAKCAPSRACIITGRNSWQLKEAANHVAYFPEEFRTFAEALGEAGYNVGHTGKGWAPGDPGKIGDQRRQLLGEGYADFTTEPPASHMSRNDYAANFERFLDTVEDGKPFCFWFGATEPHRPYEFGAGLRNTGRSLGDVDRVPPIWPDTDTVRTDMLDYAFEIEYFDRHVGRMLDILEKRGLLKNTLVVVTSDNGMPFPNVKGAEYEHSNHLPLAMMWEQGISEPGRRVKDLVSFTDFAPTFLDIAGLAFDASGMKPFEGKSLKPIFDNTSQEVHREYMVIGKERHDVGRPGDVGYPIRGIVRGDFLYLMNFHPERWPSGNPETGYLEVDGSPTKTYILNQRRHQGIDAWWNINFGKRPPEELFNIKADPFCTNNLANDVEHHAIRKELHDLMVDELKSEQDPRMFGEGSVFDGYRYSQEAERGFYERYMSGEKLDPSWVNSSDFDPPIKTSR